MMADFNEDAFQQYYEAMNDEGYHVTEHGDDFLKGTIETLEDGLFFTSIPYDLGWTVTVDGKTMNKEEIVTVADAFLAFPLKKGLHEIEFRYVPSGYVLGRNLTIGGFGVFFVCHGYHLLSWGK